MLYILRQLPPFTVQPDDISEWCVILFPDGTRASWPREFVEDFCIPITEDSFP